MPKTNFDVCIRGAGIVGRALALKLGQAKLRVALVDSGAAGSEQSQRDIRAYALNHASRQLLESLRCWPDDTAITAVQRMEVHGDTNGRVDFDAASASQSSAVLDDHAATEAKALAWIVDVPALEDVLKAALRFQSTVDIVKEPVPARLTAICEGKFSASRDALGIASLGHDYPQQAIATRVKASQPHGGCARQWFSGPHIVALLPLGGAAGDEYAVVWSTSFEQAGRLSALSDSAFAHELETIVNGRGADSVSDSTTDSASHAQRGGVSLTLIGSRARWPLRLSQASHWCGAMAVASAAAAKPSVIPVPAQHRATPAAAPAAQDPSSWVLLGDAAHTVHPLSGSGLNLGLGDVATLSTLLLQQPNWRPVQDLRVLRQYERERKAALQPFAFATDSLQWLFWQELPLLQSLRNWGMRGVSLSGPLKDWLVRQAMNL